LTISILPSSLARERLAQGLARLDAAAGQMPAADIGMLDQKNSPLLVDDQAANPEA
jgi:hypothetical protein